MSSFVDWLRRVVAAGESVQAAPPAVGDPAALLPLLRDIFARHALDVGGPPVAFDPPTAVWAAETLAAACWQLVGDPTPAADDGREPATPGEHLTADSLLRFLPAVYRRAKARDATAGLVARLDAVFRRWPLTGVLLDLDGSPAAPPDFGGHPGLQLLYAERLADNPRAGWLPPIGRGRDWAEKVFDECGRPLPRDTPHA